MVTRGLKYMDKNLSWKSSLGLRVLWGEMGKYEPLQHSRIMAGVGVCRDAVLGNFVEAFLSFLEALGQRCPIQLPVVMGMFRICAAIW